MATLPLSRGAVEIIKEQRKKMMRQSFSAAASDAFVFTGRTGKPLARRNALRAWQNATEAVLGETLRLHDLRTTLASRLAANNVDVPTAQALLRHARPSTTLDIYTRVRGDAAARLEPDERRNQWLTRWQHRGNTWRRMEMRGMRHACVCLAPRAVSAVSGCTEMPVAPFCGPGGRGFEPRPPPSKALTGAFGIQRRTRL